MLVKIKKLKVLSLECRRWFMTVIGLITHSRRLWDSDVWSSQAGWASDQNNHLLQRDVLLLLLLSVVTGELARQRLSSPMELAPSSNSRPLHVHYSFIFFMETSPRELVNLSVQKPNSWTYNIVEVSEFSSDMKFCLQCLRETSFKSLLLKGKWVKSISRCDCE